MTYSKLNLRRTLANAILHNIPLQDIYVCNKYKRVNVYNIPSFISRRKYQELRFDSKNEYILDERGISDKLIKYLLNLLNTKNNGYSYIDKKWYKDENSTYIVASGFVKY